MTRANGSKFHQTSDISLDSRRFVPSRSHWSSNTLGFVWKWDTPKSHGASSFSPFRWPISWVRFHIFTSHMPGPQPNFSEAVWFTNAKAWAPAWFLAVLCRGQVMTSFPGCSELEALNIRSGIDVFFCVLFLSLNDVRSRDIRSISHFPSSLRVSAQFYRVAMVKIA